MNFIKDNFSNHSVLDIGCGDGSIPRLLAERSPKQKITGVDMEKHDQWDIQKPANLKFQKASLGQLPFKENSYDLVIMKDVLHHLPDPEESLREIAKIAKKQVLIIEANRYNPISYVRMVKIAGHEHFSHRKLKKIIGQKSKVTTVETHVWPKPLQKAGKVSDFIFNKVPPLSRLRNYNFLLFQPTEN